MSEVILYLLIPELELIFSVIFCCVLQIVEASIFIDNSFVANILGAAGSPTLLCILGGHLLINLKEAGELGVNEGTNYRSNSVSDIDFAEGQISFNSSAFRQVLLTDCRATCRRRRRSVQRTEHSWFGSLISFAPTCARAQFRLAVELPGGAPNPGNHNRNFSRRVAYCPCCVTSMQPHPIR